jgi:hypothetical protein
MRRIARSSAVASAILVILSAAGLGQSTQLIPWGENRPLTWKDFQGTPPANAASLSEAASIHMTVKWHTDYSVQSQHGSGYTWIGTVQSAVVSNSMNPRFSWVVSSKATATILRHEQFHFDLNEVYKRRLEAALIGLQVQGATAESTMDLVGDEIRRVADEILDRLEFMQERYDSETANGSRADIQAQWEEDIKAWLIDPEIAP